MTLATVAGRVGISTVHLSQIERGQKNLNNSLISRIAAALEVQPEDLFSGETNAGETDPRARLKKAIQSLHDPDSLAKLADYAETIYLAEQASPQKQ